MTHYQRLNSDTLLRMTENQVFYSGFTTLLNFDKLLNVVTLRVMHIEKLLIQNFRGLQEIALNFPQNNLAVFIGTNGAGKSSILDCIAIMLAQFIARLRNSKKLEMRFTENDININSNFTANTITILAGQGERYRLKNFADYDNYPEKDELRTCLLTEQGHICCYCMQRISSDKMKIEHCQSQDILKILI